MSVTNWKYCKKGLVILSDQRELTGALVMIEQAVPKAFTTRSKRMELKTLQCILE